MHSRNQKEKAYLRRLALAVCCVFALPACGATAAVGQGPTVDTGVSMADLAAETGAQTPETAGGSAEATAALLPHTDLAASAAGEGPDALRLAALLTLLERLQPAPLPSKVQLAVQNIPQGPELPNGCEVTAAAIALNYLGVPADKLELADQYLPKGEVYTDTDPEQAYMGDPSAGSIGYYCYPGPVVQAVNAYLDDAGRTELRAQDISGTPLEELKPYLAQGIPVLVWVTKEFAEPVLASHFTLPNGEYPYYNLHCVVLTGYEGDTYYLADPLKQSETVDAETLESIYTAMGQRALVITEN